MERLTNTLCQIPKRENTCEEKNQGLGLEKMERRGCTSKRDGGTPPDVGRKARTQCMSSWKSNIRNVSKRLNLSQERDSNKENVSRNWLFQMLPQVMRDEDLESPLGIAKP